MEQAAVIGGQFDSMLAKLIVTGDDREQALSRARRALDEYVVEGHIPVEVIATVLNEQPEIGGIALPGMPAGSPGMGGTKRGAFTIYAVGGDRTGDVYTEF